MTMQALPATVYALCLAASTGCAVLLIRSYLQSGMKLILWSALCFVLLALNNLLVVVDLVILPTIDLRPLRQLSSFLAVSMLIFGFIWESE